MARITVVISSTSETTFTVPSDYIPGTAAWIQVIGGGGSGAKASTLNTRVSSGGGGALSPNFSIYLAAGNVLPISIGTGGTSVTSNSTAGVTGGDTHIGAVSAISVTTVNGSDIITVNSITGTLYKGTVLTPYGSAVSGLPINTYITDFVSGTGSTGTYYISTPATASGTITTLTPYIALAKGGLGGGTTAAIAAGGSSLAGYGDSLGGYSGGNGEYTNSSSANAATAGAGSAAYLYSNGGAGGRGPTTTGTGAGGGGGVGENAGATFSTTTGGKGGDSSFGVLATGYTGGSGGTNGNSGSVGGYMAGGGGGGAGATIGGNGGSFVPEGFSLSVSAFPLPGVYLFPVYSGGGAGGSGGTSTSTAAQGGLYGGGGAAAPGGGNSGAGAQGAIIFTYEGPSNNMMLMFM
jgi:hypothetical protein